MSNFKQNAYLYNSWAISFILTIKLRSYKFQITDNMASGVKSTPI